MAAVCGRAVEILSERTEYSQVFANADGSRTLEQSVEPQRAREGTSWVPVDTTLKRTSAGVVPKAAVLPMVGPDPERGWARMLPFGPSRTK